MMDSLLTTTARGHLIKAIRRDLLVNTTQASAIIEDSWIAQHPSGFRDAYIVIDDIDAQNCGRASIFLKIPDSDDQFIAPLKVNNGLMSRVANEWNANMAPIRALEAIQEAEQKALKAAHPISWIDGQITAIDIQTDRAIFTVEGANAGTYLMLPASWQDQVSFAAYAAETSLGNNQLYVGKASAYRARSFDCVIPDDVPEDALIADMTIPKHESRPLLAA